MTVSPAHSRYEIADASQVGEARRSAVERARSLGLGEACANDAAIVASELATNILKHAGRGELLLRGLDAAIEIVALDRGPGIGDVERAIGDGFSTRGTLGAGLGAIRRLATRFDIWSGAGGTVIVACIGDCADTRAHVGAVCVARDGERECGDSWCLRVAGDAVALLVVDGLGHGPEAAQAADAAVAAFSESDEGQPLPLIEHIDGAMRQTRGGAAAVAAIVDQRLHYCGVGNISGRLDGSQATRGLVSHNGIIGGLHRRAQAYDYAIDQAVLLIMHSDGVQTRWNLDDYPGLRQRSPTLIAAVLYRDFARGHDDATVVVFALDSGGRR